MYVLSFLCKALGSHHEDITSLLLGSDRLAQLGCLSSIFSINFSSSYSIVQHVINGFLELEVIFSILRGRATQHIYMSQVVKLILNGWNVSP